MIYFSALLPVLYPTDAETLFTALAAHDVPYAHTGHLGARLHAGADRLRKAGILPL